MAWELNIRSSQGDLEDAKPLGSNRKVRGALENYFPEIGWDSKSHGTCDFGEGMIEFRLEGDPVELISLSVLNADPSLHLIALGRGMKWYVENESTGENLEQDESPSESDLEQIRSAINTRSKVVSRNSTSLPNIKQRGPVTSFLENDKCLACLRFITLGGHETANDVWLEYIRFVDEQGLYGRTNRHAMIQGNPEIQTPAGERWGVFFYSEDAKKASYEVLAEFCAATNRQCGQVVRRKVILPGQAPIPVGDCVYLVRASGPRRKS